MFVPPWFILEIGKQGEETHAIHFFVMLFNGEVNRGDIVGGILICVLMFGVLALAVGWVIHCLIVMVRNAYRQKTQNGAALE